MKLWLNGDLVAVESARIDPMDRGFLLGDGLFETLLAREGEISSAAAHFKRLRLGADYLGIPVELSDAALLDACGDLLRANALAETRASLRLTLTRGPGPRGLAPPDDLRPTVLITAAPAPPPPRLSRLVTVEVRRNERAPLTRFKTLNYLENILARRAAAAKGAGEAVMLNAQGNAACASAANLWIVEGDCLVTPPVEDGALPGTVRARVFKLADALGARAREETIAPERLAAADEVFLTNSLIGACPAHELDGRALITRLSFKVQAALAVQED